MTRALVLLVALAACGRDVQLGTEIDAMPDGTPVVTGNPFTGGTYAMRFLDPPQQMCEGTLAGMESSFTTITRSSLGLTDGNVTFTTPSGSALSIAGTPIMSAMAQTAITLQPNTTPLWDGNVTGSFGSGPLSTTREAADLAVDSSTTQPIEAQFTVLYNTSDSMGDCYIGIGIAFTSP